LAWERYNFPGLQSRPAGLAEIFKEIPLPEKKNINKKPD
jgi:hypothetical protein